MSRETFTNKEVKALGKQRWAAAIDPVGGEQLAAIFSQIYYGGSVAVSGLTAGTKFTTTVLPFILRGINLLGIDSVFCDMETRLNIWNRLASEFKPANIEFFIAKQVGLDEVPEVMPLLLKGQVKGRILVKC